MKETDLYIPVKQYLEGQGYTVHAEVRNCDVAARKDGELILIELKPRITVKLLCQAVNRQELSDSVYVAVGVPVGKKEIPSFGEIRKLLRRLGLGLVLVRFMKTKTRVEVALHPGDYQVRRRHKRQASIIREMDGRYAEFNKGGSPVSEERISSYKQSALLITAILNEIGQASPAQLKDRGTGPKTQSILSANHYGWFDRIERGVYALSPVGVQVLDRYREEIETIRESLGNTQSDQQ